MGLFWSPNVWQRIFHEKDPVSPFLNISSDSLFSFLLFNPVGSVPFLKSCVMLDFLFYDFLSYSSLCVCCRCLKLLQWMRCKRNSAQLYPVRAQIIWTCLDPCSVFYTLKHFLILFAIYLCIKFKGSIHQKRKFCKAALCHLIESISFSTSTFPSVSDRFCKKLPFWYSSGTGICLWNYILYFFSQEFDISDEVNSELLEVSCCNSIALLYPVKARKVAESGIICVLELNGWVVEEIVGEFCKFEASWWRRSKFCQGIWFFIVGEVWISCSVKVFINLQIGSFFVEKIIFLCLLVKKIWFSIVVEAWISCYVKIFINFALREEDGREERWETAEDDEPNVSKASCEW